MEIRKHLALVGATAALAPAAIAPNAVNAAHNPEGDVPADTEQQRERDYNEQAIRYCATLVTGTTIGHRLTNNYNTSTIKVKLPGTTASKQDTEPTNLCSAPAFEAVRTKSVFQVVEGDKKNGVKRILSKKVVAKPEDTKPETVTKKLNLKKCKDNQSSRSIGLKETHYYNQGGQTKSYYRLASFMTAKCIEKYEKQ